jgi:hypothetical protein
MWNVCRLGIVMFLLIQLSYAAELQSPAQPDAVYVTIKGGYQASDEVIPGFNPALDILKLAEMMEAALNQQIQSIPASAINSYNNMYASYCPTGYDGRGKASWKAVNARRVVAFSGQAWDGHAWVADFQVRCVKSAHAPVYPYLNNGKKYHLRIVGAINHTLPHPGLNLTSNYNLIALGEYHYWLNHKKALLAQFNNKFKHLCRGKVLNSVFANQSAFSLASSTGEYASPDANIDVGYLTSEYVLHCANEI